MAKHRITDETNGRFMAMMRKGIIEFGTKTVKSGRYNKTVILYDTMKVLDKNAVQDEIDIANGRLTNYLEARANGHQRMGTNIEIEEYFINILTDAKKVV